MNIYCRKHPNYKGLVHLPTTECYACLLMFCLRNYSIDTDLKQRCIASNIGNMPVGDLIVDS